MTIAEDTNDLLAKRPYDILAIDGIDVDLVMKVDRIPDHSEKVIGHFVGRLPGGTVANYACAASRLGMQVASLSTVSDDQAGELIVSGFEEFNVATEFIIVQPDIESPFTVILIEPSGERSIIVVPMNQPKYDDDYLQRVLSQVRALHMMPNDAESFVQIAKIAHAYDVMVMIDVEATIGADMDTLQRILKHTDIASFNERGLKNITGEEATIPGARSMLQYGPQAVTVTMGERGALAVTADEGFHLPGWQVPVVDTTGGGDTFNAAFMTATLRQIPLERRLVFANAAAALSITGLGPRGNLPTTAEVEAFIANAADRA